MENVLRPRAVVLPRSAEIPQRNLIQPPPNRFTHQVVEAQPYYYARRAEPTPDGRFAAGTKLAVLVTVRGGLCWAVDRRGLYVLTSSRHLKALATAQLGTGAPGTRSRRPKA